MTLLPTPFCIPAVLGPEQRTLQHLPRIFALQMFLQQAPTVATLGPGSSIMGKEGGWGRTCIASKR